MSHDKHSYLIDPCEDSVADQIARGDIDDEGTDDEPMYGFVWAVKAMLAIAIIALSIYELINWSIA